MFNRDARTQRQSRRNWRDIVLPLLPFLPVVLLFATLDILAPFGSSGQKTLEVAAYAMVTIIIPLMDVNYVYRKVVRAHVMLSLVLLSYYLTSIEAISHGTTWTLVIAPGVFIIISSLLTRPQFERLTRRVAFCGAVLIFITNIYLADILRLWWLSLIISLTVGGAIWLLSRMFSLYPRYIRFDIGKFTLFATLSMVLISLFLAITALSHTTVSVGATFLVTILARVRIRLLSLKQSILIWCVLILLILVSTCLFAVRDSQSLIVCALAGFGIVGAVVAGWRLPILPLPQLPRPHNPAFDEDYFDDEDVGEYFNDEDIEMLDDETV